MSTLVSIIEEGGDYRGQYCQRDNQYDNEDEENLSHVIVLL